MKKLKNKPLLCGEVKRGKSYFEEIKNIKRICISWYGIGFVFATPKVRAVLIDTVYDFIDLWINNESKEDA